MSFAREGLVYITIAALIAAGTYALALNRRSWPLWLLAFFLTVVALWVAYFFRAPARTDAHGEQVLRAPADRAVMITAPVASSALPRSGARPLDGFVTLYASIRVKVGELAITDDTDSAELAAR